MFFKPSWHAIEKRCAEVVFQLEPWEKFVSRVRTRTSSVIALLLRVGIREHDGAGVVDVRVEYSSCPTKTEPFV